MSYNLEDIKKYVEEWYKKKQRGEFDNRILIIDYPNLLRIKKTLKNT